MFHWIPILIIVRVSLCNSTTAEEPIGLKCILDKICLSFIFNWVLAETNKLTLIISQIT